MFLKKFGVLWDVLFQSSTTSFTCTHAPNCQFSRNIVVPQATPATIYDTLGGNIPEQWPLEGLGSSLIEHFIPNQIWENITFRDLLHPNFQLLQLAVTSKQWAVLGEKKRKKITVTKHPSTNHSYSTQEVLEWPNVTFPRVNMQIYAGTSKPNLLLHAVWVPHCVLLNYSANKTATSRQARSHYAKKKYRTRIYAMYRTANAWYAKGIWVIPKLTKWDSSCFLKTDAIAECMLCS